MSTPESSPPSSGRLRLGLRRETSILLPIAMLLVIGTAVFTLFSYRNGLGVLAEERRAEAERLARSAAAGWSEDSTTSSARLRGFAPQALGVAVVEADGTIAFQTSDLQPLPPPNLAEGGSTARGPDASLPDRVSGYARLPGSPARYLRVDLPAAALVAQRSGLRLLLPITLLVSTGALILVVLFGRHVLAPYDALLDRARAAGALDEHAVDEIAALLKTFERALAEPARRNADDDIAALERTLAPSLESGLLLLDREGRVVALNPAGVAILGTATPAPGTPLDAAFPALPAIAAALSPALTRGATSSRHEVEIERRGERRSLGITVHALRRDDGVVRGYLALFADLTALRRKEDEGRVAESLAQLGELTAGLAHELRNSLATLRGYLTLIERRPEEERLADYMAEIRRESEHLQRVLEDFLSFARPGSARLESVDLEALLRRVALDPALGGAAVDLADDPSPLPLLRADPQLLERALRNLLHNAVEAQHAAGNSAPVRVSAERAGDDLRIAIEDAGPGVPADLQDRLFLPFASARPGGVGLGLALAHRIVTLHGGRLTLEPLASGGTRALVILPLLGRGTIVS